MSKTKNEDRRRIKDPKDPDLRVDVRSGLYYYRGTPVPGHGIIERSLGVSTRGLAVQAKKELLLSLSAQPKGTIITVRDAALAVLRDYDKKIELADGIFKKKIENTKATISSYIDNHLVPSFGSLAVQNVTKEKWEEYVGEARAITSERTGKRRMLKYDRRYLLQILEKGRSLSGLNFPDPELILPDREKKRARRDVEIFTEEEIRILLKWARGNIKTYLVLGYKMGLRPIEVFSLPWSQIDFKKNLYVIREENAKRNEAKSAARTIAMNKTARAYLEELYETRLHKDSPWLCPSKDNPSRHIEDHAGQWQYLIGQAEIPFRTAYAVRHTAITEACKRMAEINASSFDLARYFGTSVGEIDGTYLHLDHEDTKHVAGIMDIRSAF
jgi:integrase